MIQNKSYDLKQCLLYIEMVITTRPVYQYYMKDFPMWWCLIVMHYCLKLEQYYQYV